ncbi:MAG TPA: translation initiation factor [Marinilabiliales bacterium]|jgi:translation initiation factor 1|nr:MAG: translation initiation factor SUI1 [Bacteroidetes bacterium GWA2_40_14]OFX61298.1 MAG: translation initiation factor SUI1 [Bacteroidetes bacterium GWC2_40_13]OFX73016.1 MAG: translation initiation factor SUI1 [Bacteroidetes bacterium GWD2_40_43]OFX92646.1 MAG: translation initiation factor SUI1 [Bacteroidetes bacterium GWE2_40_63]OFY17503.1 MAG: translation initiation factor SUI1 [Bacteroidetes bacterium GWF2_40_13]OFZ27563.1 MAG: translation initiation factor SUI1 [Bacteroidetes bacte
MAKKDKQDWKDRLNVVYSTDPNFKYEKEEEPGQQTLPPNKQNLKVSIDRKQRGGKSVTLVQGFVGTDGDLKELSKLLKTRCGVGGSAKDGEMIIQGEFKQKVAELLTQLGYKVKTIGG